jgi:hypothetical protein
MPDLANYAVEGTMPPLPHFFVGEGEISTSAAPSLDASIAQFTVCALTPTGVTRFVVGTHTKDQMVIAMQPITAIGQQVPIATGGKTINHESLVWPTGLTLDTFAERLAFTNGTQFQIGKIINHGTPAWAA